MTNGIPKYRRHPSGQAFVQHRSIARPQNRLYLGTYGSPESKRRYQQVIARIVAGQEPIDPRIADKNSTVDMLILKYLDHAESYYADEHGKKMREFTCCVESLRPLSELFGEELGRNFGPRSLATIQNKFIDAGYCRTTVNGTWVA